MGAIPPPPNVKLSHQPSFGTVAAAAAAAMAGAPSPTHHYQCQHHAASPMPANKNEFISGAC